MADTKLDELQGPLARVNALHNYISQFSSLCSLLRRFHPYKRHRNALTLCFQLYQSYWEQDQHLSSLQAIRNNWESGSCTYVVLLWWIYFFKGLVYCINILNLLMYFNIILFLLHHIFLKWWLILLCSKFSFQQ